MITPHEVKMALDRCLLDFARGGGPVPTIKDVHSAVICEDGVTVSVGFDLDCTDEPLWFEFPWPVQQVSRDELSEFAHWLAAPTIATLH